MKKAFFIIIGIVVGIFIIYTVINNVRSSVTSDNTKTKEPASNQKQPEATPKNPIPKDSTPSKNLDIKDTSNNDLTSKTWQWVSTTYSNYTKIIPKDGSKFRLTFRSDGTFGSSTDCNGIGGKYVIKNNTITFSDLMSTEMYCVDSQEAEFSKIFEHSQTFAINPNGELRIDLKFGAGYTTFR